MITAATAPAVRSPPGKPEEYLSWSRISTYQMCPLRWYFKYDQCLPEPTVAASLVLGGSVHAGIERHYRSLLAGEPAPDIAILMDAFDVAWAEHAPETIRFGEKETKDSLRSQGERILRAFQASELANPQGTIIGIEEEMTAPVIPGAPRLLARLDLVIDAGAEIRIVDFKTARSRWSREHSEDVAAQLLLYGEVVREVIANVPLKLEFAVLTKTKEPAIDVHEIKSGRHETRRAVRIAERVWKSIQSGNIYPVPSPMTCAGCPFQKPCRGWTG